MRRYCRHRLYVFLLVLISFSFGVAKSPGGEEEKAENKLSPQSPRYEFKLNLNEFSILNSSMVGGLDKYGGGVEFYLRMAKEEDEIVWTVTITNPKLIEVLGYWTAEKSAELLNTVDVDNLDAKSKLALATMKSLNEKVAYAQENPLWDPVRLSGAVIQDNGVLFIEGQHGKYEATGDYLGELEKRKGKRVVAVGYIKLKDQIEVSAFLDVKVNTLELFVMSLCPFSKKAEAFILDFLDSYPGKPKPSLEIHYIFYRRNDGDSVIYSSLHGEKEINENLVQVVIRDKHPQFYHDYLLERVSNNDIQWMKLAKAVGMLNRDIESIQRTIDTEREALIEQEYDYVTGTYQIYDGSPAYVWECERVADVRKVEAFKGLNLSSDQCAGDIK